MPALATWHICSHGMRNEIQASRQYSTKRRYNPRDAQRDCSKQIVFASQL